VNSFAISRPTGSQENFVARQAAFDRALGQRAKLRLLEFAEKLRSFQRGDFVRDHAGHDHA
jgi:hypothetical protein